MGPVGVLTLAECEKKCEEMADCTGVTMEAGDGARNCWRRKAILVKSCDVDKNYDTWLRSKAPPPPGSAENLMTKEMLGEFEDEGWEGYACTFSDWAACVNSTCNDPKSTCHKCTSKRSGKNESITCSEVGA